MGKEEGWGSSSSLDNKGTHVVHYLPTVWAAGWVKRTRVLPDGLVVAVWQQAHA